MSKPILEHVKDAIGIDEGNLGFNTELLSILNSTAAALVQLGLSDYAIEIDEGTEFRSSKRKSLDAHVKSYFTVVAKTVFDPTASETIASSRKDRVTELEGRISHENDDMIAKVEIGVGANLIQNGCWTDWTGNNPDNWVVIGENQPLAGIEEVGSGESSGGGGTGYCNIFTSDSALFPIRIYQPVLTPGKVYRAVINYNHGDAGGIWVTQDDEIVGHIVYVSPPVPKSHEFVFLASGINFGFEGNRGSGLNDDITLGCVELYLYEVDEEAS